MGSCLNPWCGKLSAGTGTMYFEPNLGWSYVKSWWDVQTKYAIPGWRDWRLGGCPRLWHFNIIVQLPGSISFLTLKHFSPLQPLNRKLENLYLWIRHRYSFDRILIYMFHHFTYSKATDIFCIWIFCHQINIWWKYNFFPVDQTVR